MIIRLNNREVEATPENTMIMRYETQDMANGVYIDLEDEFLFIAKGIDDRIEEQAIGEGVAIVRVIAKPDWECSPHKDIAGMLGQIVVTEVEEYVRES